MWSKIFMRLAVIGLGAVPWETIVKAVLSKIGEKIEGRWDVDLDLTELDCDDLKADVEQILADTLNLEWDWNGDGHIGHPENAK